jgi:hypothetical protein
MANKVLKLSFMDRFLVGLAMKFMGRRLEEMLGSGWKGKIGAAGVMLSGAAAMLTGAACVLNNLIGQQAEGGGDLSHCWELLGGGFVMFSAGLSQYGIRDAVGPSKKNGEVVPL